MEVHYYNPKIGTGLLSICTYAATFARKNNCLVQINYCEMQFTCNPDMTAAKLYSHINYCITK